MRETSTRMVSTLVLRFTIVAMIAIPCLIFAGPVRAQQWGDPLWSDEFNSSENGAPPDARNWTYDIGGTGWGNHELEIYCAPSLAPPTTTAKDSSAALLPKECDREHPNAFQDGQGHLVIRARKVSTQPAPAGTWTSARLKTLGLKEFQYGRMEACIRLPSSAGLWPAFWMLGTAGHWPAGGEIDIMENILAGGGSGEGLGPSKVESTIHGPSKEQSNHFSLTQVLTFPNPQRIDDTACHVYGAIWSPFMIQMYIDDWRKPFFIRTAADVPKEGRWIFNAPFYFVLNLAVGGDWPGPPDSTSPTTADMVVDYVRVYKAASSDGPKITASPIKSSGAAHYTTTLQLQGSSANGAVFLSCTLEGTSNATCSVDTGNALNASVVDFATADSQSAKVSLTIPVGAENAPKAARIVITAYAANGAQSAATIPVE